MKINIRRTFLLFYLKSWKKFKFSIFTIISNLAEICVLNLNAKNPLSISPEMRIVPGVTFIDWLKINLILRLTYRKIPNIIRDITNGITFGPSSPRIIVSLEGWTNSIKLFKKFYLDRFNIRKIKYLYRRDIVHIPKATGFQFNLDVNKFYRIFPKWENSVLNNNSAPMEIEFPVNDMYGYIDNVAFKFEPIKSRSFLKFFVKLNLCINYI